MHWVTGGIGLMLGVILGMYACSRIIGHVVAATLLKLEECGTITVRHAKEGE